MIYKIFNSVFPEWIELCDWTMGKGRRYFFLFCIFYNF